MSEKSPEIEKILSDLEEMQTVLRILSNKIIEIKDTLNRIDFSSSTRSIEGSKIKESTSKSIPAIPPSKVSRVIDPLINEIKTSSLSSFDIAEIIRQSLLRLIGDSEFTTIRREVESLCDEVTKWSVPLLSDDQKDYIISNIEKWRKILSGS